MIGNHLSPEHAAKTMIHETAHVLMGTSTTSLSTPSTAASWKRGRERRLVVAGLVGFDTSAYSVGYVAGWAAADVELIRGTAARVLANRPPDRRGTRPEDDDTTRTPPPERRPGAAARAAAPPPRRQRRHPDTDPQGEPPCSSPTAAPTRSATTSTGRTGRRPRPHRGTCDASSYDVGECPWRCTRRPGHTDDEHRAAFELHGDGPAGVVAFACALRARRGRLRSVLSRTVHTVTVTVTFPSRPQPASTPTASRPMCSRTSGSATTTTCA